MPCILSPSLHATQINCTEVPWRGFCLRTKQSGSGGAFPSIIIDLLLAIKDVTVVVIAFGCSLLRGLGAWKVMQTSNYLGASVCVHFAIMAGCILCYFVLLLFECGS